MSRFDQTSYQKGQINVINEIERQVKNNNIRFSTVDPTNDYVNDSRICLTSVHFPSYKLLEYIDKTLIQPLKKISPEHYYYDKTSIHMTIKNVRTICNPPDFNLKDINRVEGVFRDIIPKHRSFRVFFYRLLLFPTNLTLIGTTDPELDLLILELDKNLIRVGVPDNKQYSNNRFFFINITLARFAVPVSQQFIDKAESFSTQIVNTPYIIDSVSLVTSNAALKKLNVIDTWYLKK